MTRRVLVVEDHELWRERVCAELGRSPRYQIVGQLADGAEAVDAARALKPDVILLDIGLLTFSGIEAARRIVAEEPNARILFLTAQRSVQIAEAALSTGARGYLLKTETAGNLQLAVETVANGGWFISPGLPPEIMDVVRPKPTATGRHDAVVHSDKLLLGGEYVRFAEAALDAGKVVVMIADGELRATVQARLASTGIDVDRAVDEQRYLTVDSTAQVARLIRDGCNEEDELRRSSAFLARISAAAGVEHRGLAVCGAVSLPLWRAGCVDAAIGIERAWDTSIRAMGGDLLCGYLLNGSRLADEDYEVFQQVCGCHQTVHVR